MDPDPTIAFVDIIHVAQASFEHIVLELDTTPARAILRIQAQYGPYRIFITELIDTSTRKYRYYVLHGDNVEVGFDNSPDPRALRLKYGRIGEAHAGEPVPHLHQANKIRIQLTAEISFTDFIDWLHQHLPVGDPSTE